MTEENKAVVRKFIAAISRFDLDELGSLLAPDATVETPGHWSASGVLKVDQIVPAFAALGKALAGKLEFTEISLTAESDRVAVELQGRAVTVAGDEYNNHYCQVYWIKDGKITFLRDYMDSALAEQILVPLLSKE